MQSLGFWDILLIVVVSLQATLIAYLYAPRWKAFVMTLPLPFTISSLGLGQRVGAGNVLGLIVLLVFAVLVRVLHCTYRVPIILAIALSAAAYCLIGGAANRVLPGGDEAFWLSCVLTAVVAAISLRAIPVCEEQGYRSPLPVPIKLVAVAGVVFALVLIKSQLQGFMTVFPMVGVVAAYESRKCLWTFCRQMPVLMLTLLPLIMVSHVMSPHIGLGPSLAIGWAIYVPVLAGMTQWMRRRERGRYSMADA